MMQDFDQHAFAQQLVPTTVDLSVSEMIELAKAGVAIELAGLRSCGSLLAAGTEKEGE